MWTNPFHLVVTEKGDRIAGFLFEPIQGEAGVWIFSPKYLLQLFLLRYVLNNIEVW